MLEVFTESMSFLGPIIYNIIPIEVNPKNVKKNEV